MRPWASVRCKSQPPRFVVIHCDAWPPRAFQLFVSFRDRSPVTIKLASHPGQPYAVKPRPHAAPQFSVLSRYVSPSNSLQLFVPQSFAGDDQTGPQLLLQVHEPRRGPNASCCRVTCLYVQLCRPVSRYSECRTALFRHRSGFTSKTLPHVHQPYVVKVSPTPRHVLRRAATRDLAIPPFS